MPEKIIIFKIWLKDIKFSEKIIFNLISTFKEWWVEEKKNKRNTHDETTYSIFLQIQLVLLLLSKRLIKFFDYSGKYLTLLKSDI